MWSRPATGWVSNVRVRPGRGAWQAGTPAFPLVESGAWWVNANFKETDLARIRTGSACRDHGSICIRAMRIRRRMVESISHGVRRRLFRAAAGERHRQLGEDHPALSPCASRSPASPNRRDPCASAPPHTSPSIRQPAPMAAGPRRQTQKTRNDTQTARGSRAEHQDGTHARHAPPSAAWRKDRRAPKPPAPNRTPRHRTARHRTARHRAARARAAGRR